MGGPDFQAVVDTCFYGVVYATRAAIPVMRKQKKGLSLRSARDDRSPEPCSLHLANQSQVVASNHPRNHGLVSALRGSDALANIETLSPRI